MSNNKNAGNVLNGLDPENLKELVKLVSWACAANLKEKFKLSKHTSKPFQDEFIYKKGGDTLTIVKEGLFKTFDGLISDQTKAQVDQDDYVTTKLYGRHALITINSMEELLKIAKNGLSSNIQKRAVEAMVRDIEKIGFSTLTNNASNVLGSSLNKFDEKYMNTAAALLNSRSVYEDDRYLFVSPSANAQAIESMKEMFRPNNTYKDGKFENAYGITPEMSNFVQIHTVGTAADDTITVDRIESISNGSYNTKRVYVKGLTGKFNIGDNIYFDGIFEYNPVIQEQISGFKTFSVVSQAADNSYIELSEEIKFGIPLQNVLELPKAGTKIVVVGKAGERTYENLLIQKDCVASIFIKDSSMKPGVESHTVTDSETGISITVLLFHDPNQNQTFLKIMTSYAFVIVRQEGVIKIRSLIPNLMLDLNEEPETKARSVKVTK